jgi:hypothetical protein
MRSWQQSERVTIWMLVRLYVAPRSTWNQGNASNPDDRKTGAVPPLCEDLQSVAQEMLELLLKLSGFIEKSLA